MLQCDVAIGRLLSMFDDRPMNTVQVVLSNTDAGLL
jgi:hypothetical protein